MTYNWENGQAWMPGLRGGSPGEGQGRAAGNPKQALCLLLQVISTRGQRIKPPQHTAAGYGTHGLRKCHFGALADLSRRRPKHSRCRERHSQSCPHLPQQRLQKQQLSLPSQQVHQPGGLSLVTGQEARRGYYTQTDSVTSRHTSHEFSQ